jgi:phosphopantothenoylcysteine decarboxylase/phosphopantothenate--cysteine ligase
MFFDKKIVIGVTGGIAAYKAAELVRTLKKASADVYVMMTQAATRFVSPLTFETLTENPVLLDLFPEKGGSKTIHIDWARLGDVIVLCPATMNSIGKIAAGIADNALTATVAAATVPVIICPAMNTQMYNNPLYRGNQEKLAKAGYIFVSPDEGELACGEWGAGRLATFEDIIDTLKGVLLARDDLSGRRVVVTAGRTEEPLDAVRFLTNRSSGRMGYALAEKAALRGARVILISGPTGLRSYQAVTLVPVRTVDQMAGAVLSYIEDADVLLMAAAVGDFRFADPSDKKLKKESDAQRIELLRTIDILSAASKNKGSRIHIGFSVETENEIENSMDKLRRKNLDLIVINNPLTDGAGFEAETNIVSLVDASGKVSEMPKMSKLELADRILDRVVELLKKSQ